MTNIRPEYKMKKVVINKDTIKDFYIYLKERRKIRQGKVNSMKVAFGSTNRLKRHPSSPIVVNRITSTGKSNVVDGNHRVDSIGKKLEEDSNFCITFWIAEYKDLTREQEREVYSIWNKGTPETATDYLKWHFKVIPLGEKMLNDLPVTVYGNERKMGIKMFVGNHIQAVKGGRFAGYYSAGGEKTVSDFLELTRDDILVMGKWYKFMVKCFGEFYKGNPFYTTTPASVFYRIWYDNRSSIPESKMVKAFKDIFTSRQLEWIPYMKSSGRDASRLFYDTCMDRLKSYRRRIIWKSDRDLDQESN